MYHLNIKIRFFKIHQGATEKSKHIGPQIQLFNFSFNFSFLIRSIWHFTIFSECDLNV